MRSSMFAAAAAAVVIAAGPAAAHEHPIADGNLEDNIHLSHASGNDGHVPAGINYGFEVVGIDTLGGISDEKYTDVWAAEIAGRHYAFVGTFEEPVCDRSGVFISDITDPAAPATVTTIDSPPNTRINDVKTHLMGDGRTVLIVTLEPCGPLVGRVNNQLGQGGVSLWDVSKPDQPHALKQNLLDFPVHNTFPWTTADGNTYLMLVNDVDVQDTHIVDMTKPQSPKLITTTGILDWIDDGVLADGQGATGAFAASLLHDIWVEQDPQDGRWYAVLSYWDAGFIKLDVTDPLNPVFLGDSTYPAIDPVHLISPQEGNAHAAVFGGESSEYIVAGDEDFDVFQTVVTPVGDLPIVASQGSDVPQIDETTSVFGPTVFVGRACGSAPAATADSSIAIIERGDCTFTLKAQTIDAAGYVAGVVFNDTRVSGGCEATVSMLVQGNRPMLFVPRSGGFRILGIAGYDGSQCGGGSDGANPPVPVAGTAGLDASIAAEFDGWGYLHLIANKPVDLPEFGQPGSYAFTAEPLDEIGYYAPAEVADPQFATGSGDLTMHNVEIDPTNRNRAFVSWYSLGMRAVEVRLPHSHDNLNGEGYFSRRVHEVGRFIASEAVATEFGLDLQGSNFWGVHVHEIAGESYVLASDRNTGLWIFRFICTGPNAENPALYCITP